MGNESTEPETQKVLFNINNFLCIRQRKAVSIRLCLRRLKGAPRHWDLNIPICQTSYTDNMVMHKPEMHHPTGKNAATHTKYKKNDKATTIMNTTYVILPTDCTWGLL